MYVYVATCVLQAYNCTCIHIHTCSVEPIPCYRNAYHGAGPFVMSMTALGTWKYPVAGNSGFLQVSLGWESLSIDLIHLHDFNHP